MRSRFNRPTALLPRSELSLKVRAANECAVPIDAVRPLCTDGADGRYLVEFRVTRAGWYSLTLLIDGSPIRNSAVPLLVLPALISAAHSVAKGEGLSRAVEVTNARADIASVGLGLGFGV